MAENQTNSAELADVVDLEQHAKADRKPPAAKRYRIRIDKNYYVVEQSSMTGREILALAGKTPETHMLSEKLRSGQSIPIEPDQTVDFTKHGVERFQTLPLDPTEG